MLACVALTYRAQLLEIVKRAGPSRAQCCTYLKESQRHWTAQPCSENTAWCVNRNWGLPASSLTKFSLYF